MSGTRREKSPFRGTQAVVDPFANRARLNDDVVVSRAQKSPHVTRKIEDNSGTDRAATSARSGTARMNRNLFLRRVLNDRRDVRRRARPNDASRTLLERAAVRREKLKDDFVAANVSANQAAEVFLESRLRRGERFGHRKSAFRRENGVKTTLSKVGGEINNKKGKARRPPKRENVDGAERLPYFTRRGALRQEPERLKVDGSRVFSSFLVETAFFTRFLRDVVRRLRGDFPLLAQTFATLRLGAAGLTRELLHDVIEDRR